MTQGLGFVNAPIRSRRDTRRLGNRRQDTAGPRRHVGETCKKWLSGFPCPCYPDISGNSCR